MVANTSAKKYTYRDPYLSLWQSAVAEVRTATKNLPQMAYATAAVQPSADLEAPVHLLGMLGEHSDFRAFPAAQLESAVISGVKDCAKVSTEFLWAEMRRDHKTAAQYAAELKKSVCDAGGWSTCLATYLAYKATGQEPRYRDHLNPRFPFADKAKIAIIGDWGSGEPVAANLLAEVKKQGATMLVHLGDVYYSGTLHEAKNNFLNICRTVLGSNLPVYSLCGNHDMYSGGDGYYWLVDQLGQQASYFVLENANWQLLAMDTGHSDCSPLTVGSTMTSLNANEAAWLRGLIEEGKGRKKTILLSHHQLFSPFESVGQVDGVRYGYNNSLAQTFGSVIDQIEWWFWGHEHNLGVYEPFMGLRRGRCVGCSAVPVFKDQQSYQFDSSLRFPQSGVHPVWHKEAQLGTTADDYNHAFAILNLDGTDASVEYFEVTLDGKTRVLFSE